MGKNHNSHQFSYGITSMDQALHGLTCGDNVVWQVDRLDDYVNFVIPFARYANKNAIDLTYFRFADHKYLLPDDIDVECHNCNANAGFEQFISEIFDIIKNNPLSSYYIFDSLSELPLEWYSDRMLGNFFMLVSRYLSNFQNAAYYSIIRNLHSSHATDGIHGAAQIVIDLFHDKNKTYIHPLKIENRHSPSMYMLHLLEDDRCTPVANSAVISEILATVPQPWIDFTIHRLGEWTSTFEKAKDLIASGNPPSPDSPEIRETKERLIKMAFTQDRRFMELAMEYMDIQDFLKIRQRMIGTGLIGGKSAGMVMARAIINTKNNKLNTLQEAHDSFFIGSDVFVTFLVQNECWVKRKEIQESLSDLSEEDLDDIRSQIKSGSFPEYILNQFIEMLNYFGQSPIIVRSSSLLEDAYSNAFSGKYESVFCANQGTPEERLCSFIDAVRTVYASTMSRDALAYRAHNELMNKDEQMALLVQRVSGEFYSNIYFPHLAGVGYSRNPFVWNSKIDPAAGVLRLVFGLGTHAVDRVVDDYTRIVALNEPLLRPENSFDAVSRYSQKKVDILDLNKNIHATWDFKDVYKLAPSIPWNIIASRNEEMMQRAKDAGMKDLFVEMLTFDKLLQLGSFTDDMKSILKTLEEAYNYPVDIEFAVNFIDKEQYRINLLQCRPFQISKKCNIFNRPEKIDTENIVMKTSGPFIGESALEQIDYIIYISPEEYSHMRTGDRYSVARLIGELANSIDSSKQIMLIGPGRWGSTMPELGVPVSFNEIRNTAVLCEMVMMHDGLVPDISLGTHFFNDLVEMDILYMAFFPEREHYIWNRDIFEQSENSLLELNPEYKKFTKAVRVIKTCEIRKKKELFLHVDTVTQEGILFFEKR